MNDFVNTILGGFMVAWLLMFVAAVVIMVVFLARVRREAVSERERRQLNTARVREAEILRRLDPDNHDLCA
jgi:hypothetical protein